MTTTTCSLHHQPRPTAGSNMTYHTTRTPLLRLLVRPHHIHCKGSHHTARHRTPQHTQILHGQSCAIHTNAEMHTCIHPTSPHSPSLLGTLEDQAPCCRRLGAATQPQSPCSGDSWPTTTQPCLATRDTSTQDSIQGGGGLAPAVHDTLNARPPPRGLSAG